MTSDAELLSYFREIDRAEVELAPDLSVPHSIEFASTWSAGPRVFLLFRDRAGAPPRGIVFHCNPGGLPEAVAMCDWCHAVRGHGGVRLMTVRSSDRREVGLYLCSALACVSPVRDAPSPDDLPEGLSGVERAHRALSRISDFAARCVF
jgi:hypothetical protein